MTVVLHSELVGAPNRTKYSFLRNVALNVMEREFFFGTELVVFCLIKSIWLNISNYNTNVLFSFHLIILFMSLLSSFLNRLDKLANEIIIRQVLIACLIFLERPDTAGKTGVTWVG